MSKFKRTCALAMPGYSIKTKKEGDAFYVRTMGEIESKEQTKTDGTPDTDEDGRQKIIHHAMVVDMETGEQGEMVLPYIVKAAFDSIVKRDGKLEGHAFELIKGKLKNRTNEWSVYEVEDETVAQVKAVKK